MRWRGQPGFFEIWFLVVFEPGRRRAWWLRYTTWAPLAGPARATLWAAAFDGDRPPWVRKAILPAGDAVGGDEGGVAIGPHRFGCHGAVGRVGELAWDVRFDAHPRPHGPGWLARLPAPTRVEHLADGAPARGWIERAGRRETLAGACVVAKHLWGTRRIEELFWVCCPGRFEATEVRLRADRGPRLTTVHLDGAGGWDAPWHLVRSRVEPVAPGVLRVRAVSATRRLVAEARWDPATLAGWAYRDPAGWDVHVAQSDVATCRIDVARRSHPLGRWRAEPPIEIDQAAIELHRPAPLPDVRYLGWDETGFEEVR